MQRLDFLLNSKKLIKGLLFPWGFVCLRNNEYFGIHYSCFSCSDLCIGGTETKTTKRKIALVPSENRFDTRIDTCLEYVFEYDSQLENDGNHRKILATVIKKTLLKELDKEIEKCNESNS